MRRHEDKLSEAIARLKEAGQTGEVPQEVVNETLRKMAEAGTQAVPIRHPEPAIYRLLRLSAAAAVLVVCGYATGRLSAPRPADLDQLREALAPSLRAAIEPALRRQVVEDIRRDYQLALAGTYVRVKEELTEEYRSDLNHVALQLLTASSAATNERLTQLVQSIDTAQTEDLRRIARALSEIEMNRVQDKTQLASGLQTLAYRTRELAQFVAARPAQFDVPQVKPRPIPEERNQP